jgi:hypothetical protein
MPAILKIDVRLNQTQKGFVYDCSGLQSVAAAFGPHVTPR